MSKLGSFLGGLGVAAAAGYARKRNQEASDARIAARTPGQPQPQTQPSMLEKGIDKLKGLLAPNAAAVAPPAVASATMPAMDMTAAPEEAPAAQGDEFTAGFNDNTTVSSEPVAFENIYNQQAQS